VLLFGFSCAAHYFTSWPFFLFFFAGLLCAVPRPAWPRWTSAAF
jgi:hypothetical protein